MSLSSTTVTGRKRKFAQFAASVPGLSSLANYERSVAKKNREQPGRGWSVRPPVSGGIVSRQRIPRLNTRGSSTIVSNTELALSIVQAAAGGFNTSGIPLIPSQFSWLAGISDLYSKFRFLKLDLIYIPKCPTSTPGIVAMALTYDRNDAGPGNRTAVSQCHKAVSFPPYAGFDGAMFLNSDKGSETAISVSLDVGRVDKPWYATIGTVAFTALSPIDQNQFCPASWTQGNDSGAAVGVNIGDLFVKYVVEFIEPINPTMNA